MIVYIYIIKNMDDHGCLNNKKNVAFFFAEKETTHWHPDPRILDQWKLPGAKSMRLSLWIKSKSYLGIPWSQLHVDGSGIWRWLTSWDMGVIPPLFQNVSSIAGGDCRISDDFWTINSSDSIWEAYLICEDNGVVFWLMWIGYSFQTISGVHFFLLTSPNNLEDLRCFHFLFLFSFDFLSWYQPHLPSAAFKASSSLSFQTHCIWPVFFKFHLLSPKTCYSSGPWKTIWKNRITTKNANSGAPTSIWFPGNLRGPTPHVTKKPPGNRKEGLIKGFLSGAA